MKLSRPNGHASVILLLLGVSSVVGYQPGGPRTKAPTPSSPPDNTRRFTFLAVPAIALASGLGSSPSGALDMDSFVAKELEVKKEAPIKTMSEDEALCRFGSPSKKVGDACIRAGLSTKRKNGLDAYGTIDREYKSIHNYLRCRNYTSSSRLQYQLHSILTLNSISLLVLQAVIL